MGASKGASSTGKAWVILIGGFFGVLLLELAHGTSAGYAPILRARDSQSTFINFFRATSASYTIKSAAPILDFIPMIPIPSPGP